ncbi:YxlC family protein [Bacillus sp. P14.5]|uniref:YxlC family protein n=1 Tax=Bacillus sp. P14.5 TaxID=1983400 RepID=UPI000DE8D8F8|nr:YxlC family protein [Bacillus sp. P14.5]
MKQEKTKQPNDWEDLHALFEESFHEIDKDIEENTPSGQWFEQFTLNHQEALKRKYRKELTVFLVLAVLIISVILFALFESLLLFAVIQGIAFLAAAGYGGAAYYKQVKRI